MPVSSCIELNKNEQEQLKALVWQVLRSAVEQQKFILPSPPKAQNLYQPAASFVTLYTNGNLRGCIGSCVAQRPLWQDVCHNSYSSACEDYRFPLLSKNELKNLSFDISILSELIPIKNMGEQALLDELKVGIDGLFLQQKQRSALFLPTVWRSLTRPEDFLRELKQKGGWQKDYWDQSIEIFRFYTFVVH